MDGPVHNAKRLWHFLLDENHRGALNLIGATFAALLTGSWFVYQEFFRYSPPTETAATNPPGDPSSTVNTLDPYLGFWYAEFTYPTASGYNKHVGTTEYLDNSSYNFVGQITIGTTGKRHIEIVFDVDASGEWIASNDRLTYKLLDAKSVPIAVYMDGKRHERDSFSDVFKGDPPKLEDYVPMGVSDQLEVLEHLPDKMRIRMDDPVGGHFQYDAHRRAFRFKR